MRKIVSARSHHNVTQLYVHLVFVTRWRQKILNSAEKVNIRDQFAADCHDLSARHCHLVEFGMEEDHVHLVVRYPPSISISQLVKHLKGRSSQKGLPGTSTRGSALWSAGYFAKSVSDKSMAGTVEYAREQGELKKAVRPPVASEQVDRAESQHAPS